MPYMWITFLHPCYCFVVHFVIEIVKQGFNLLIFLSLHDTPFSYVFYYPLKYYVFGRTNGNASNRNASNQHFSLYPLIMN